jgi:tRNA-Thr(GGU) m(6)t(6)A37 methyltransferase TsaA
MTDHYKIYPIGKIRKKETQTWIEVNETFKNGLMGMKDFSHIHVFYWFHENDSTDSRNMLTVHPCKNPENPLTGVFATHSPHRPNLIALSLCKIISICDNIIAIESIDARDNSPVIDMKCYIPYQPPENDIRLPFWARPESRK